METHIESVMKWLFKAPLQSTGTTTLSGTTAITGTTTIGTGATLTTPVLVNPSFTDGTTTRFLKCDVFAVTGAALHAANLTVWTAPAAAIIHRVILDITTQSSGASTIDIGYTAVSATTTSDTLLDGVSGASVAIFDSMNAALDSGANANAQKAASGKWITADEATGDVTGLVANVYVFYSLI